ncbi:MAG: penicillin acylase family protein, partial [Phenylobacterium sp.]
DLTRGYVAGYNRYLRDTPPAARAAACRNAAWVRPITVEDMLRLTEERMIQGSASALLVPIVSAKPPAPGAAPKPVAKLELGPMLDTATSGLGSNGWAFGRDVTANGSGLLLGNPHFPWETTNRFYEVHLTIPGKLDAMGVSSGGGSGLSIGFNKDVAWTHTVSTDRHFTLFELKLDPADPTAYFVDGKRLAMTTKTVTVEVAGAPAETRTLYSTIYGPVVATPATPWTTTRAYALRDANRLNMRAGETWVKIASARSVGEIKQIIDTSLGIPWVNTIAADRNGDALYADVTATPNVSGEFLKTCAPPSGAGPLMAASRFFALDGSRSACNWPVAQGTAAPGLMPAAIMPTVTRTDYVANSNDSFWLANPKAVFPEQSPIVGPTRYPQGLRTRAGILEIEARLDGSDGLGGTKIDPAKIKTMLYANRNLAADLYLDDVLKICGPDASGVTASGVKVDLAEACKVLSGWDRRTNIDSVGAILFLEFSRRAEKLGAWTTPFDPADPVHTPRGLNVSGANGAKVAQALAEAVELMRSQKLPLDAPYGAIHFAVRGAEHIPVHGGDSSNGVLNAQQSHFVPAQGGYVPYHGSSFIEIVTFDAKGPVAEGILTYSQSTDPASPYYADQTRLHAKKGWKTLPFHRADVMADAVGPPLRISE